mmetsp:Transcript_22701/g.63829  ORF Transcript_22701/g.63829 Transcript_22701/m.63829 type:complete len:350 (+) Transcript_22701:140-1189(+)
MNSALLYEDPSANRSSAPADLAGGTSFATAAVCAGPRAPRAPPPRTSGAGCVPPLPPPPPRKSGTSWPDSRRSVTRDSAILPFPCLATSPGTKSEVARPGWPARPVRPMRWTYESKSSLAKGKSMLITCSIPATSSPRAATSVATSTLQVPARKAASADSRCDCERSPWISSAAMGAKRSSGDASEGPPLCNIFLSHVALRFFSTKTSVRPLRSPKAATTSASFFRLSACASTMRWVMVPTVLPTRPTVMRTKGRKKALARFWISVGKVAENKSVCRDSLAGISATSRRICGSKPISSMRSASSRTRKRAPLSETSPRPTKSLSRPGVATTTSQPIASARACPRWSAPP